MRGSPFFDGVVQADAKVAGYPGKLPCFYYDTSLMLALFPARYRALRNLMPDPRFVPARLAPGLGVVTVACFEYRDSDIGPYNEVGISVLLNHPSFRLNLPGRALLDGARHGQVHSFMLHLPVTTEVAMRAGIEVAGFPKFLASIDFDDGAERRSCLLAEDGERILSFSGERLRPTDHVERQFFVHLWMDRQPQRIEFKVSQLEAGRSFRRGAATLELGARHPMARELDRLLVSRRSLEYEFVPRLEGILYGPDHLTLPLLKRLLGATTVADEQKTAA
jgi:Acetoacetate decarboxylase (ADC)